MGKKGGATTAERYGSDFYAEIGRKGGLETAKKGIEYFQEIGRKGGQRVRELIEAGRKNEETDE